MGSPPLANSRKKTGLSAPRLPDTFSEKIGGDHSSPNSLDFYTGSKNTSSLDYYTKKVGQSQQKNHASGCENRCENPHGMYFICEHGHPIFRTLSCHARFEVDCPYCARNWRRNAVKNLKKRVSIMRFPALVSLTLKKPSKHALLDLNKLVQLCRKYLRRKGYKIRGAVSCLDPPNHTHAVWDCSYIPQRRLSEVWHTISGDSFIVDIRKVEKHRWKGAVNYLSKYITKISKRGNGVNLCGVHIVNSWGQGGYYKKVRMVCKKCGSYFTALWYAGQVDDYENDPVDFVISNKGPPLKYLRLLAFITGNS